MAPYNAVVGDFVQVECCRSCDTCGQVAHPGRQGDQGRRGGRGGCGEGHFFHVVKYLEVTLLAFITPRKGNPQRKILITLINLTFRCT